MHGALRRDASRIFRSDIVKILVLHGPNMNLLGKRDPDMYGTQTLGQLEGMLADEACKLEIDLSFVQSNHEGVLIDTLQEADGSFDAVIFNPAAYSHTSIALRDCIEAIDIPVAEVHLSKISARETFRQMSQTAPECVYFIEGEGVQGYIDALHYFKEELI